MNRYLLLVICCGILGCGVPKTMTTITGGSYDKKKDRTSYFVIPYGSASLPGNWVQLSYNNTSRQQFFRNKDSVEISVAFGPANKFEFSKPGLKGFALAKTYYEWESKYQREARHGNTQLITQDSSNNYVLWKYSNGKVAVFYLFAGRECDCSGGAFEEISIRSKSAMTEDNQIKMLRDIYLFAQ